jgi:hypothetical protein
MQRMTALDHISHLVETIGPRGSTMPEEAAAATYASDQLRAMGLTPQTQKFLGAESAYAPYALFAGLALLSIVLFWRPQPVGAAAAALLTGVVLAALLLEMQFRSNVLRWLSRVDDSQNIFTRITASTAPAAQTVLLTAHLDTHRTPLIFSSPTWQKVFGLLMPAGLISAALLLVLFVVGVFVPAPLLRWASLVPGVIMLAILLLMLRADNTPFTRGADDNASGVGVTLSLAQRLQQTPLAHTDVIVVFTGCEEVGCYGADAFMTEHAAELRGAIHLTIDQVGARGTNPCVVRGEQFFVPVQGDPGLLAIADGVIARRPDLNISTRALHGAYGELSIGVKHGLRAIAIGALNAEGISPHWHKLTDDMSNIDPQVVERCEALAWELLQDFDAAARG